jgi:hypothetical protein
VTGRQIAEVGEQKKIATLKIVESRAIAFEKSLFAFGQPSIGRMDTDPSDLSMPR